MLVLKVDNFEKFTVGSNAFLTLPTRSTKHFCLRLHVHLQEIVSGSGRSRGGVQGVRRSTFLLVCPFLSLMQLQCQ